MKDSTIENYIQEAEDIEELFCRLLDNGFTGKNYRLYPNTIEYYDINNIGKALKKDLLRRYEIWFEVCKRIVEQYTDKKNMFEKNYELVIKKISIGTINHGNLEDVKDGFISVFGKQANVLHTVIPLKSLKKADFRKIITADLLNSELEQAEILYEHKYYRASGAIAGIVLERYLKTRCEINNIIINSKDTIDPLATKLYKDKNISDFDIILLKSIQHLASIRNKCTHPKEEPKQHEVRELIDKTKKITYLSL